MPRGMYERQAYTKKCAWCGREFTGARTKLYCTDSCQRLFKYYKNNNGGLFNSTEYKEDAQNRALIKNMWEEIIKDLRLCNLNEEEAPTKDVYFVHVNSSAGVWVNARN